MLIMQKLAERQRQMASRGEGRRESALGKAKGKWGSFARGALNPDALKDEKKMKEARILKKRKTDAEILSGTGTGIGFTRVKVDPADAV